MAADKPTDCNVNNPPLAGIKDRIRTAQYAALRQVNRELVGLYWDIGRMIVERQDQEKWGKAVVQRLAADLQTEFPGARGYSAGNLWAMRRFFLEYRGSEKLQSLIAEIGWAHNLVVLRRCRDDLEREFYIRMTRRFGWTVSTLVHHVESGSYERYLLGRTDYDWPLTPELRAQAKLAVRNEHAFDFLAMGEEHSDSEPKRAFVAAVDRFLRSTSGAFAFMGSRYRLEVDGAEHIVDLLLYDRRLRSLVAVQREVGELCPEHVGEMRFCLAALDRQVRVEGEKPSIGMIVHGQREQTGVEYALRDSVKATGTATYRVTTQPPRRLQEHLPSPEQVEPLLEALENRDSRSRAGRHNMRQGSTNHKILQSSIAEFDSRRR